MKPSRLSHLLNESRAASGRWKLTPNHELEYRSKDPEEEFVLTGALIAAEPNALVFSVTERQTDQQAVTSIHKLGGSWSLNAKNQIIFNVGKEQGKNDVLTFTGGWKVNEDHEIVYTYEKTRLKRKVKESQELVFKGVWEISEKNRLTYLLSRDSNSAFRFRGAFQTHSIFAKKGEIRYQAGVEVAGRQRVRTIILFGKWKLSRDLSLDFEIETAGGRKKSITFGGDYALDGSSRIAVNLRSGEGRPLGIELILTKDIFGKDGQAFVRLQRSLEGSALETGMRFKW